jgi:ABC-type Mn2+/Zn2+ transport system permease subunit
MTDALIFSLIVGVTAGLAAGYLGSLMVLEKMALVGDALSHVALPGLALGLLFHFEPILGGFAFLFVSTIVVWHLGRVSRLSFETLVGAMFTLALAIGILITPEPDLLEALFGNITNVTLMDMLMAVIISVLAISLTKMVYNKVVLSLISEELATSTGVNVARTNLLYLLLVSTVVAIGIKITGTLLVGFLVVVPAAAARSVSSNLYRYTVLSAIFGAISSSSGVLLSSFLNLQGRTIPPGPLVVLSGIAIFAVALLTRWLAKVS